MDEIKRMDLAEFRELGFLQEVNRLFFHPLGLALEMTYDEDLNEWRLSGIWDYREDPEGIVFEPGSTIDPIKIKNVDDEFAKHVKARENMFGDVIQW
jgi:hypothetical protein